MIEKPQAVAIRTLTPDEVAQKNKLVNDTRSIILPINRVVPSHFEGWMRRVAIEVSGLPFALYEIGDLIGKDLPDPKKVLDIFKEHAPDHFSEFAEYVEIGRIKRQRALLAVLPGVPDTGIAVPAAIVIPPVARTIPTEAARPVEVDGRVALTLDQVLTIRSSHIPMQPNTWEQINNIKAGLKSTVVDYYLRANPFLALETDPASFPKNLELVVLNAVMKISPEQVREYLKDDPTKVLTINLQTGLSPAARKVIEGTITSITQEQVSAAMIKDPLFVFKAVPGRRPDIDPMLSEAKNKVTAEQLTNLLKQSPKALFDMVGLVGWVISLPNTTQSFVDQLKFEYDSTTPWPNPKVPELEVPANRKVIINIFKHLHGRGEIEALLYEEKAIFANSSLSAEFKPVLAQLRGLIVELNRLRARDVNFVHAGFIDPKIKDKFMSGLAKISGKVPEKVWDGFVNLLNARDADETWELGGKLNGAIGESAGITNADYEQKSNSENEVYHLSAYWSKILDDRGVEAYNSGRLLDDPGLVGDLLWYVKHRIKAETEFHRLFNSIYKREQDFLDSILDPAGYKIKPGDKKYRAEIIDKNPLKRLKW